MSRAPLQYHQPLHPVARVVMAIGGAIPLWGAYDLLIAHGMPLLQWGMAPFVVMGVIALCFGSLFFGVAIFGGSRTVTIDRGQRACFENYDGTFGLQWRRLFPFSTLKPPIAVELPTSDGPGHWAVQMAGPRKPLVVETYPDEARARAEADAISAYMAGA